MGEEIFQIGGRVVTLGEALVLAGAAVAVLLLVALLIAWRRALARAERGQAFEARVADLVRAQTEMQGRMQTMAEVFGSRQSELVRGLSERMDGLGHRLGQTMSETTRSTHENLSRLAERLAVIDKAQQNITSLSSQVVELQHILANKQTRGAFGEARMQAIVQDGLPKSAYAFQPTLSNGTRPDCLVLFPNDAPSLVIDAKFPLEAWNTIRTAEDPEMIKAAETRFRRDTQKHIQDIAERYHIPGETHDTAFMFVPSESIFADIHERFEDIVQRAHRARVVIVSPSLLMLSVQVVMSLLRDANMREQAHVIQHEVIRMMEDVARLDDRVQRLKGHFAQANKDIEQIEVSAGKITKRGAGIESVEIEVEDKPQKRPPAANSDGPPELPFQAIGERR
ncbi:MAG: DNA recombination protein RmuC [Bauldia sp.]|uniref:DNA recombination protein RmuC n=1 Tax=Bauldia sp. TaxID=2575872 RepID=UPI001DC0AE64|nr:DNA recombination protein RmuC [Bauldia sp.]MCB1496672.1 DNA recombination protein RmuC [Bauldia sp.]